MNGLKPALKNGTFRGMRLILVFKYPALKTNISTSGSMHRLVTWPALKNTVMKKNCPSMNFDDFINRVNADLIGKVVNIASRCAGFINKRFENCLAGELANPALYQELLSQKTEIINNFIQRDYAYAIRQIMECADKVNQY